MFDTPNTGAITRVRTRTVNKEFDTEQSEIESTRVNEEQSDMCRTEDGMFDTQNTGAVTRVRTRTMNKGSDTERYETEWSEM